MCAGAQGARASERARDTGPGGLVAAKNAAVWTCANTSLRCGVVTPVGARWRRGLLLPIHFFPCTLFPRCFLHIVPWRANGIACGAGRVPVLARRTAQRRCAASRLPVGVRGAPMPSGRGWRWPRALLGCVPIPGKAPRPGHVSWPADCALGAADATMRRAATSSHARVCTAKRSRLPQGAAPAPGELPSPTPALATSRLLDAALEPPAGHLRAGIAQVRARWVPSTRTAQPTLFSTGAAPSAFASSPASAMGGFYPGCAGQGRGGGLPCASCCVRVAPTWESLQRKAVK